MTLFIARHSAMVRLDGVVRQIRRGRTIAHADNPIVAEHLELWKPLRVDFPADESAPALVVGDGRASSGVTITVYGSIRSEAEFLEMVRDAALDAGLVGVEQPEQRTDESPTAEPEQPTAPAPKDVRAWAKAQGIDVPARGKLPDDLVARYEAEQAG